MRRGVRKRSFISVEDAREFVNHLLAQKESLKLLVPLVLAFWVLENWVLSLSNWVPLVVAVWATIQYGNHQRRLLVEDLNKRWNRVILNSSAVTPLEQCEWLNKLLTEIWPCYISRKLSMRFASMVERRLRRQKSRLMENIKLLDFSLGSSPPSLGLQGAQWSTSGDKKFMRLGFDWDTSDMSILLQAKLAKPLYGTARIVVNSLHIKGDILLTPVLDGRVLLYSFVSTPEVRIGVAFGSGGSQSLPATELPGVSSWLVKILTDTLDRRMVEPRRGCLALPAIDLRKTAVGGIIHVTVVSASKIGLSSRGSPTRKEQADSSSSNSLRDYCNDKVLQTFMEVELGELTRRTDVRPGSNPTWHSTFNMVFHDTTGILRFNLFEFNPGSVKYDNLATCEVKVRYVADDSTIFWAIGPNGSAIARHAEHCGKEVEMVVPFEGIGNGELSVRLVLKEWQFSDGSHGLNSLTSRAHSAPSLSSLPNFPLKTGRKISITMLEGKDLISRDRSGKSDVYVKLQYGKAIRRSAPVNAPKYSWNQKFEFDELAGGEYLKVKCYSEEVIGSENLGHARVNLEGLVDGAVRDIWVPLEKVSSGELRLLIEAVKLDDHDGSRGGSGGGWVELVIVEARDLIAADLRGTSDPYVRVNYGEQKRRTKVMFKTLNPKWNQTFEFPDDGSSLELHVKDHNALLPTSSIGNCSVEYQWLPPNEVADKWIPLQGVKRGEIHVRITRKVLELARRPSSDAASPLHRAHLITGQMKQLMMTFQTLIEEGNTEEMNDALGELESLEDEQGEYLVQLETEQMLLINKIKELGKEILGSSPNHNHNRRSDAGNRVV